MPRGKWKIGWSLAGAFALAIAAWAQPPAAPPAPRGFHISGTVVDDTGGSLLGDVEVAIGPAEGSAPARSVVTGTDGRFDFGGLSPGKYWLAGNKRGYGQQNFDQHEIYSTAIAVGPGLRSQGLVFRLKRDAAISGTITDEANEPIRDAQVMLFRSEIADGVRRTRVRAQSGTDDQGHYHFSRLRPGTYYVAVTARPWYAQSPELFRRVTRLRRYQASENGGGEQSVAVSDGQEVAAESQPGQAEERSPLDVAYPITFYAGSTEQSAATPITLKEGDRATADVGLPVPALHLHITGVHQEPDAGFGANLSQRVFDSSNIPVEAQTTALNGDMEISGAAPGQYELHLQSFGKNAASSSQVLNVSDDADITAAQDVASPTISGIVRLDGAPAPPSAFIRLTDAATGESLTAQVADKGEFEIQTAMARPGNYEVEVANIPGVAVTSITATGAKVTGHTVEIGGGETVRLNVLSSRKLGRVNGVALRDGKPVAGVMVVLVPHDARSDTSLYRRDQSNSDGTFSLFAVPPGRYTVVALADGWNLEWQNPAVLDPFLKNGESIDVRGEAPQQVKVKVQ